MGLSCLINYELMKRINGDTQIRMDTDAKRFLLIEYDADKPAEIGTFDIKKVMRKGKGRYMPFVAQLNSITM